MTIEQLRQLIRLVDASDVTEVLIEEEKQGLRLALRKPDMAGAASAAELLPVATESPAASEDRHVVVTAALVGIFHTWSKPKGPAAILVGDRVLPGQTIASIETLGLLNEVEAPCAGTIVSIEAQDGQPVEYGQPLIVIEPLPE
jgi:acetyl-CoA carboxylase biotin carboxyl carrier protein